MKPSQIKAVKSSRKLAEALKRVGDYERAGEVASCGSHYSFYVCHECGQFCELSEIRCGHRLCAQCAKVRVSRLHKAYGEALSAIKEPRMLTVSMRSRPLGELAEAIDDLWAAFTRLRHRRLWKQVLGAIVALEITYNRKARTWHPHLHMVLDCGFLNWFTIHAAWNEVTLGEGNAVFIQKCKPGWERELIKYVTKVNDILGDDDALKEFIRVAYGRRFIRTYGTLYNCAAEEADRTCDPICSGCGAVMKLEKRHVRFESICGDSGDSAYCCNSSHQEVQRGSP